MAQEIITMRDFLEVVIRETDNEDVAVFANKEIEKIDKRNKRRRETLTETQKENKLFKTNIISIMMSSEQEVFLAKDIANELGVSSQKASVLLRQMAEEAIVDVSEVRVDSKGSVKEGAATGAIRKAYNLI